jgi:GTP-binding protein LepA
MDAAHIRNFSIIAHIDHGKTTLSDRLLHRTGTIATRDMEAQLLDSMDLERERGITIKAHPVTMRYQAKNGETYELNLIDTPGHVDFSYEVSRSLSACEGALLIIDAAQGVEAQTVANVHLAMKQNLTIIPVINKIDLPHANVPETRKQLEDILAIPGDTAILASAKEGIGIDEILEAIVERIPAPKPTGAPSLQALGFDSLFDTYKGVITHVRVFNGELKAGMHVKLLHSGKTVEVKEVGSFNPKPYVREKLEVGETGYFTANIKSPKEVKMGEILRRYWRGSRKFIRWCSAGFIPSTPAITSISRRTWASCSSTTRRLSTSRRHRSRSVLVSVAGFSVCCTWKLCRNGCAANTAWTSSRRTRAWCIA